MDSCKVMWQHIALMVVATVACIAVQLAYPQYVTAAGVSLAVFVGVSLVVQAWRQR